MVFAIFLWFGTIRYVYTVRASLMDVNIDLDTSSDHQLEASKNRFTVNTDIFKEFVRRHRGELQADREAMINEYQPSDSYEYDTVHKSNGSEEELGDIPGVEEKVPITANRELLPRDRLTERHELENVVNSKFVNKTIDLNLSYIKNNAVNTNVIEKYEKDSDLQRHMQSKNAGGNSESKIKPASRDELNENINLKYKPDVDERITADVVAGEKPQGGEDLYEDLDDIDPKTFGRKSSASQVVNNTSDVESGTNRTSLFSEQVGNDEKLVVWYLVPEDMEVEESKECGGYKCYFTMDTSKLEEADAIIVDGYLLAETKDRIKPVRTSPNQSWIFHSNVPWTRYRHKFPYQWNSIFNWTFTFDRTSDFITSDSELVHLKSVRRFDWLGIMKQKTRKIVWINDECTSNSRREEYVKALQKYIPVDIVGKCGNKCIGSGNDPDDKLCFRQYMFYLSFEDTLCKDYVTHEFFKTFSHHIVPIVRGGAIYNNLYPPSLYINTSDFTTPKHLARFLIKLMRNQTEYLGYLQRRVDYAAMQRGNSQCMICSYLHHLNIRRKSYPDLSRWLDNCESPKDLPF